MHKFIVKNEKIIGTFASAFSILMFISLFEIITSNLSGKSNIVIQPLATSVNGLFWGLYGYGKRDLFIIIPNLLALTLGILTVISAFL